MFFFHLFRLATLAKGALALSLIAGAYGAGNSDVQEYRLRTNSTHVEATNEPTTSAEPTAMPEATAKPQPKTRTEDSEKSAPSSFEALLKECVARYSRRAEDTKEACDGAMAASGLGADAFWAKYRSLMVAPKKPETTTAKAEPKTTTSFEALLGECVARYQRAADNTKEACERAIAASGLTTEAFAAKYRSLLVPSTTKPRTTETQKPASTDPAVKECLAKYETLKTLKTGPAEAFYAALRAFNETCKPVLEARR